MLVSLELLRPPVRLSVFGAGNDVQPLVRLAAGLGWRVEVLDGRPAQAQAPRFLEAEAVRVVPLAAVAARLATDGRLTLLLSHNYHHDRGRARGPAGRPTRLHRPARSPQKVRAPAPRSGENRARLAGRLHSPIGLNLGAETPGEIALSIVAEVQAVVAGRPTGFLRDSDQPIHAPARPESFFLVSN